MEYSGFENERVMMWKEGKKMACVGKLNEWFFDEENFILLNVIFSVLCCSLYILSTFASSNLTQLYDVRCR